jgi:hypothetical protein
MESFIALSLKAADTPAAGFCPIELEKGATGVSFQCNVLLGADYIAEIRGRYNPFCEACRLAPQQGPSLT